MKLSGSYQINLSKEKVWEALNDPEILKKAIPGCEEFTKNSETEFTAKATNKIGPFNASFTGDVELKDLNPPNSYKITGSGNSPVGFASGEAFVKLEDHEQGTKLIYEVEANVGGKIAQVGSRLIDMTAKKMADIFFGKFSELISSTDEGNNKDKIDQKLTNQNNIKSKNQNKILIYSAVVVGALILAYFIF
ncbi:SRPBCC family protein [Candidatus Pelagibacter sp.]|uniref:SRPBCC family protein n=1 Tax=Candidatus Pelagibacter sp. TaxID=2024849 RepID=UPI003F86DAAC